MGKNRHELVDGVEGTCRLPSLDEVGGEKIRRASWLARRPKIRPRSHPTRPRPKLARVGFRGLASKERRRPDDLRNISKPGFEKPR